MPYLPLQNILHYKLRSALSAMGIGVGVCLLITLSGLSRGSLGEIADRWEAVGAELIAAPHGLGDSITTFSGAGLRDSYKRVFQEEHRDLVQQAMPVFLWRLKVGSQEHTVTGIDAGDWAGLTGGKKLLEGRLCDSHGACSAWLEDKLLKATDSDEVVEPPTEAEIAQHGGMEMVIDARLAKSSRLKVGQQVEVGGHTWTIVGIAPSGVMTRVFVPRRVAQRFFAFGSLGRNTLMFVKLKDGVQVEQAGITLAKTGAEILQLRQYRDKLEHTWGMMFKYIDIVNAFALVIAFLFIMITLYMMVIQRTRDIAILKSFGASSPFILRQVLAESLLLTLSGTVMGIALSIPAAWLIGKIAPLLTVQFSWRWIAVAVLSALAGALFSAIYPAWRATKIDMVEALTLE